MFYCVLYCPCMSDLAIAILLKCSGQLTRGLIKLSFLIKNSLPQTTSRKAEGCCLLWYVLLLYVFFIFQLQLSFPRLFIVASGTCVYFESSPAHVPAVPGTLIADCFTQIRWELSFVKECLSLTIMMIPSLWPRCKCRVSTCISQIVWFKKQTSALKGKKKKKEEDKPLDFPAATIVPY